MNEILRVKRAAQPNEILHACSPISPINSIRVSSHSVEGRRNGGRKNVVYFSRFSSKIGHFFGMNDILRVKLAAQPNEILHACSLISPLNSIRVSGHSVEGRRSGGRKTVGHFGRFSSKSVIFSE